MAMAMLLELTKVTPMEPYPGTPGFHHGPQDRSLRLGTSSFVTSLSHHGPRD